MGCQMTKGRKEDNTKLCYCFHFLHFLWPLLCLWNKWINLNCVVLKQSFKWNQKSTEEICFASARHEVTSCRFTFNNELFCCQRNAEEWKFFCEKRRAQPKNIQWYHINECWKTVLNCCHWLPTFNSPTIPSTSWHQHVTWTCYEKFCRNVIMVGSHGGIRHSDSFFYIQRAFHQSVIRFP